MSSRAPHRPRRHIAASVVAFVLVASAAVERAVATPDLVVDQISYPPAACGLQDVTVIVKNVGTSTASAGFANDIEVALWVDGTRRIVLCSGFDDLAPGATHRCEWSERLDSGLHNLEAMVDYRDDVDEGSNEGNNRKVRNIFVQKCLPDLVIRDFSYVGSRCPGGLLSATVRIANEGFQTCALISCPAKVRVYLDGNRIESPCVPVFPPLEVSEVHECRITFSKPAVGTYTLRAMVDPDDQVDEVWETNNWSGELQVVVGRPDLVVESLTVTPDAPNACDTVEIKALIKNVGPCKASFGVNKVVARLDGVSEPCRTPLLGDGDIDPNESFECTWTSRYAAGEHPLVVRADPDGLITESDESAASNTLSRTLPVARCGPDIVIASVDLTPSAASCAGEPMTATVSLRNEGNREPDCTGFGCSVLVGLWLGDDGLGVNSSDVEGFLPGHMLAVDVDLAAPLEPGVHLVTARALANFSEIDPDNNEALVELVVAAADLSIEELEVVPLSTGDRHNVSVRSVVRNVGSCAAAPAVVAAMLDGEPLLPDCELDPLAAGEALECAWSATVTEGCSLFEVAVDGAGLAPDENRQNNVRSTLYCTQENCGHAWEAFDALAEGLSLVDLGPVAVTESLWPDGTPAGLDVVDCSGDGFVDLLIPWSGSGGSDRERPAVAAFDRDLCDASAPRAVSVTLAQAESCVLTALDEAASPVGVVEAQPGAGEQTLYLSAPVGVRSVRIEGAGICVVEVCWACTLPLRPFRRADANGDGELDVSDAVFVLLYLFAGGGEPPCLKSADVDDTGVVELPDAVYALGFLFQGGAPPLEPFSECGDDPTRDELTCETHAPCAAAGRAGVSP